MSDLNSVLLIGRLTRDIELSYFQSGAAMGKFSLAVNRSRKQGDQYVEEAYFFDVCLYGKPAESLQKYLTKGKQVAVEGSLKQDRWNDRDTGKMRSRVSIVAETVQLLSGSGGQSQQQGGYQSAPQQGYPAPPAGGGYAPPPAQDGGEFPEDVPF